MGAHPLFASRSVAATVLKKAAQTNQQASVASPQVESSQRTFNERRLRYNEKSDTPATFNYCDFNGARRRRELWPRVAIQGSLNGAMRGFLR